MKRLACRPPRTALPSPAAPPGRRAALLGAGAFATAALLAGRVAAAPSPAIGTPRKLTLSWSPSSLCHIAVPVAVKEGFFIRHGLDVDLISWGSTTDALLASLSTGKADIAVGMVLRWIKPLEQGFDVRLTGGTHAGCMRIMAAPSAHIANLGHLRGKRIGIGDVAGVDKNFFAIALKKAGVNPVTDVDWRTFPPDMLGVAISKGEVDAISTGDPLAYNLRRSAGLIEIASNMDAEYANRACCVIAAGGALLRNDRPAAAAATLALVEAADWAHHHPAEAAAIFAPYAPTRNLEELTDTLRSYGNHRHPTGRDFRGDIIAYVNELKDIEVIKPSVNAERFADRICVDVLAS
ncbi:ABC transporter substrate-binding protein [Rhodovastum atsumiense]|nr:ABC transporter substrate-binding protein [Rhodovastum atsumiense]